MAIVSVKTRLGYDHEFSLGEFAPTRIFSEYYWVYSDIKNESPATVRTATGLPQVGDVHPADGGSIVQAVRLRRDEEHPKRWEAEVQYSSENIRRQSETPENLVDLEKVSIQTRQGQRLIDRRLDGTAIVNSAGDLIEGITVPWNSLTIVVEQYVAADPGYYVTSKWINAINSATWRSVPAYFAQIESLNYEEVKSPLDGSDCWKRTATVKLAHPDQDPYGFRLHVLNAGMRAKLVPLSARPSAIMDGVGMYTSKPQLLKSDGTVAESTDPALFINASPFPEFDFNALGI